MSNAQAYWDLYKLGVAIGDLDVSEVIPGLAEQTAFLVDQCFADKQDIHGNPWPHNKTLPWYFDSDDNIRKSISVDYGDEEIYIRSDHIATCYQAYGTVRNVDPKNFFPDDRGLGLWADPWNATIELYFQDHLHGRNRHGR